MNDSEHCDIVDHSVQNFAWNCLRKLYEEKEMFDITLLTKDGEVSAHKIIVASVSTYLKLFLTSELTVQGVSSVDLSFCSTETLKTAIGFIYTREIQLSKTNIFDLIALEDYLGLGILRHHLEYFLMTTLSPTNCWTYLEISLRHNYCDAAQKADLFIRTYFMKLTSGKRPEFLRVPPQLLLSFFDDDFLDVSDQEQLLINLCEWLGHAPKERLDYLDSLLSKADITRIPSWRGISERLSPCSPPDYQSSIVDWVRRMSELRTKIPRKPLPKSSVLETVFIIGGYVDGEAIPSVAVFTPPFILFAVLPKSFDQKQLSVIPTMKERRAKPTAVSTRSSVYVIGGTGPHEELKANGVSCEVYRIRENKWELLPSLPQHENIVVSRSRVPPAAYANGNLYAALPSPKPSFWILTKNDTSWEPRPSPSCYEIFDLVGLSGAVYSIGKETKDSRCYLLERYDSFSQMWWTVSTFHLDPLQLLVKCLAVDSCLCVTTGDVWLRFDPHKSDWVSDNLATERGGRLNYVCCYKGRQVVTLKEEVGSVCLQLISSGGSADYSLPDYRRSASLVSLLVPTYKPETI